jgi:F-type H+-transporting ATPase subunit b
MKFNWWTFLFEALNFVVLAYVLHRLLYRPLRAAIEQRQAATAKAQADAEQARKKAEALQQQLQTQLAELERHRQETIHEAREQAKEERKKLLAETEQTLEQRREESRQAMENEHREALKALHGEVVTQAVELTRRLLHEATDQTLDRQLALRLVQSLQELSETERADLQAQCQAADGAVLETAQELDAPTLEQIANAVTAVAGKPVALTVQTKPALVGGVRLRVGGQVWDGSLAGQLQDGVR